MSLTRFIVVPLRVADDLAIARYTVPAARTSTGAILVIDIAEGADEAVVPSEVLEDFRRTAAGNRQQLVVVAEAGAWKALAGAPGAPAELASVGRHDDLAACLEAHGPAGSEVELELVLPARLEYLGPVRRHLAGHVRRLHGDEDAFPTEILVDELCLNAVENSPSDRSSYDVSFRCGGAEMTLEVTNPFDDTVDSARIMHRRLRSYDDSGDYLGERGRGLFLVARIADGLSIRPLEGGRIQVTVTRRLGREGEAQRRGAGSGEGGADEAS